MASASVALRTAVAFPRAILLGTYTKLSLAMAAYIGIATGAHTRALGSEPKPVIDEVREEVFTEGGRIAEHETAPRDPIREWAVEQVGPWITEPLFTTPESWNAAVEQTIAVPMIRAMLSLMDFTAGIGYWLAGYIPAPVIGYGGVVVIAAVLLAQLRSLRAVIE